MSENNTSNEAILERFKIAYVNDNPGVKDAWLEDKAGETWIVYLVNTDPILEGNPLENDETLDLPEVPHEFEGLATIITLFPREDEDAD